MSFIDILRKSNNSSASLRALIADLEAEIAAKEAALKSLRETEDDALLEDDTAAKKWRADVLARQQDIDLARDRLKALQRRLTAAEDADEIHAERKAREGAEAAAAECYEHVKAYQRQAAHLAKTLENLESSHRKVASFNLAVRDAATVPVSQKVSQLLGMACLPDYDELEPLGGNQFQQKLWPRAK